MPAAAPAAAASDADVRAFLAGQANARGIPTVMFIDDVSELVEGSGHSVEVLIGVFTELHQKYKMLDASLRRQKENLKSKLPEIENTLDIVRMLERQQNGELEDEMLVNYPLADTVHARAQINCNGTVCLWLGADVMVEYSYDEAIQMLEKSLTDSRAKLVETREDLDHLKDQSTTVEVNMARVFNYNVKQRRLAEARAKEAEEAKKAIADAK